MSRRAILEVLEKRQVLLPLTVIDGPFVQIGSSCSVSFYWLCYRCFLLGQLQHYNGKGAFIPVYLFQKRKWSDVVAQNILNLGTRRKKMVNLTPGPVYPQGRRLRCSLNR